LRRVDGAERRISLSAPLAAGSSIFLTPNPYQDKVTAELRRLTPAYGGLRVMGTEKRYCSICAWRESCRKRYSIATDASGCVRCPDYSRDLSIKDRDIDAAEKACREG
jgi:hypothetical protein